MCEMPETINKVERKARKEHKCCECGSKIKKGETYRYTSGIWSGEPDSFKQSLVCAEIMDAAIMFDDYDGVAFGEVKTWFDNFQCRGFTGKDWLNGMAEDIGVKPEKLNHLLCV